MTLLNAPGNSGSSTRPYLIRALHEWCTENGFTPYVAVFVDASVRVPPEYVKNNEIVLNVGFEATSALQLGNEFIEFKARFGGSVARDHGAGEPRDRDLRARERPGHGVPGADGRGDGCAGQANFRQTRRDAKRPRAGGPHLALRRGRCRVPDAPQEPPEPPHAGPPCAQARQVGAAAAACTVRGSVRDRAADAEPILLPCRAGPRPEPARAAGLAQLVEHPPCKRKVIRSIRIAGTNVPVCLGGRFPAASHR